MDRRLGADDGTSLFACAICGVPARFPTELKYTRERLFVHNDGRHGKDDMRLEEVDAHRTLTKPDRIAPSFPIGIKAGWQV